MRLFAQCCLLACVSECAYAAQKSVQIVKIPYMERVSFHRVYADALLTLALDSSVEKFGPYEIVQENKKTVIRRQLLELEAGNKLSVAVSMPMPDWLAKAQVVYFPIMKGLASYRMFFLNKNNALKISKISNVDGLKQVSIGQGQGWSTANILVNNGFKVVFGGEYTTLLPMLKFNRFDLLMRSIYEIGPEFKAYQPSMPELDIVNGIAVYTYLPMYFFVSKREPELASRLEYGLRIAYASGRFNELFYYYFRDAVSLLNEQKRTVFMLKNTNIDASFFARDKPYLLKTIQLLGEKNNSECCTTPQQ